MYLDLPALQPIHKMSDGLKIWGAGTEGRKKGSRGHSVHGLTWSSESLLEWKQLVFGGLKSFLKNLLFFVELWFQQLFSDSCLYMLEFSSFHCTYLRTVTSFRILFLIPCCLSTNILYIHNGWRLTVVSRTILVQCREKKNQIILLYSSRV